ncbi:hypothetical protein I79_006427 [Cricetulus griseus]|uniref:Uncharacterized protein n=1 Tax=Cricetulus griseus TaxID=10029 RepID=G3H7T6_CRIGR|nr:hypothetical protein I79_006427 [Cricetulus griseus]
MKETGNQGFLKIISSKEEEPFYPGQILAPQGLRIFYRIPLKSQAKFSDIFLAKQMKRSCSQNVNE